MAPCLSEELCENAEWQAAPLPGHLLEGAKNSITLLFSFYMPKPGFRHSL